MKVHVHVCNKVSQLALVHAHVSSYCVNDHCIKKRQSDDVKQLHFLTFTNS